LSSYNKNLGDWGEKIAVLELQKIGFSILETNVFCSKFGEIDIIAKEEDTLVFIEVKTRASTKSGEAIEAMTPAKQKKIIRSVLMYLKRVNKEDADFRIDVATLDKQENGNWKFCLMRNAVNYF